MVQLPCKKGWKNTYRNVITVQMKVCAAFLYQVAFETDGLKLASFICESQYILFENRITPGKAGFPTNGRSGTEKTQPC